ncbi:DUF1294 domain-containing protein [Devosia sediminis]|uniref:Cold shock and DUF1294 domain-containing protein n=1 Tax=Devosia sediminis TaxID=2798801 RepID=A0A934J0H2_9HYPH|nr:DUF1294 domain-containing protein [Devosia sediminis]MBJ3786656.1 cold shock and DUF1294 domain-containing protein [Devosia sediminis]
MPEHGLLVQWNDERGFGFVEGRDGQRHFVHISAIARIATRPRIGDSVSFVPARGEDGRLQARAVEILGANPAPGLAIRRRGAVATPATSLNWRYPLSLILIVFVVAGVALDRLPIAVALAYLGMGIISFLACHADKRYAENGHWRISEVTLLGLDLAFGIVGGLLGQATFRHKTRKPGYVTATVLILAVHLLWLVGFATGLVDARQLVADMAPILGISG